MTINHRLDPGEIVGGITDGNVGRAIAVDADGRVIVEVEGSALPPGAATEAKQDDQITLATAEAVLIGAVTETAPASDTASSGLNGRLQRVAQRVTSLIALVPASLGQKVKTGSFAVTLASDDDAVVGLGAPADAAVTNSASSGSVIALLKGLVTLFFGVASGAADSGNPVKIGGRYNATLPTLTDGQRGDAQLGARGALRVEQYVAGATTAASFNARGEAVAAGPDAVSRIVSAAGSTNATSAKASAGRVYSLTGYNVAVTVRYLKVYDKASAPTVGTDTPVLTLALPPLSVFAYDFPGLYLATGIAYALTTGSADADTGALTAGDVLGLNVVYA